MCFPSLPNTCSGLVFWVCFLGSKNLQSQGVWKPIGFIGTPNKNKSMCHRATLGSSGIRLKSLGPINPHYGGGNLPAGNDPFIFKAIYRIFNRGYIWLYTPFIRFVGAPSLQVFVNFKWLKKLELFGWTNRARCEMIGVQGSEKNHVNDDYSYNHRLGGCQNQWGSQ